MAFEGSVREWLFSITDMYGYRGEDLIWTKFKSLFLEELAVQTNYKVLIDGLANMAMKLEETTMDLLNESPKQSSRRVMTPMNGTHPDHSMALPVAMPTTPSPGS
jgi:hypothetical protein